MQLHLLLILLFAGSFVAGARIRRQTDQNTLATSSDASTELVTGNRNDSITDLPEKFVHIITTIICFSTRILFELIVLPQKLILLTALYPIRIIFGLIKWSLKLPLKILSSFLPIPV